MVRPYLRRKHRGEDGNPTNLHTLLLSPPPDAFSRSSLCIFAMNAKIFFARCEKYSSKLDISRSFLCIFAVNCKIFPVCLVVIK